MPIPFRLHFWLKSQTRNCITIHICHYISLACVAGTHLKDSSSMKTQVETHGFGHLALDVMVSRVGISRGAILNLYPVELSSKLIQEAFNVLLLRLPTSPSRELTIGSTAYDEDVGKHWQHSIFFLSDCRHLQAEHRRLVVQRVMKIFVECWEHPMCFVSGYRHLQAGDRRLELQRANEMPCYVRVCPPSPL